MKRFFTYLLGISISMSAIGAQAATTYQYTGNNFGTVIDNTPPAGTYTTSMSVIGSFTVTEALAAMTSTNLTALKLKGSVPFNFKFLLILPAEDSPMTLTTELDKTTTVIKLRSE